VVARDRGRGMSERGVSERSERTIDTGERTIDTGERTIDRTSARRLSRALQRLVLDRDAALAFRDGDASAIDRYELEPDARRALLAKDIAGLYELGAHPVVLFHLSAILHTRAHFVREVVPAIQTARNPFYDYYRDRASPDGEADGRG